MEDKPLKKPERVSDEWGLESLREPSDAGLSLDQLSEAFAHLLKAGDDPYAPGAIEQEETAGEAAPAGERPFHKPPDGATAQQVHVDDRELSPRGILEAVLFVGMPDGSPISSEQVAALMRGVRPVEIDQLAEELNRQYEANHCPYRIASQERGYRLVLREEFERLREKLQTRSKQAKLSPLAVKILAVAAYNQPVSREKIGSLVGKTCASTLTQLVRRQLLKVERDPNDRRLVHYRTTERFLELFGLRSLKDLPEIQDLEVL